MTKVDTEEKKGHMKRSPYVIDGLDFIVMLSDG